MLYQLSYSAVSICLSYPIEWLRPALFCIRCDVKKTILVGEDFNLSWF